MALMTRALVTNGPMPTISIMFRATASFKPRPRSNCGGGTLDLVDWGLEFIRSENNKGDGGRLTLRERRSVFNGRLFLLKAFHCASLAEQLKLVTREA